MRKIIRLHKKHKHLLYGTILAAGLLVVIAFVATRDYAILDAKGTIAQQQRGLLLFAGILSLFVVIPVYILLFFIVWKYRDHKQATYTPDWDNNRKLESLWWGLPTVIILILSIVTWQTSHSLDPFKPLASSKRPLTIQVVALQWKWLFIYPEQNVATVNYVQFPVDTPVHFQITADAPMNSFWIPQLGGQIYAMTGMSTSLNLQANEEGRYRGSSANISGEGFAGMRFMAQATSQNEFDLWSKTTYATQQPLNLDIYKQLASPSSDQPVSSYHLEDPQLYNEVIDNYMGHSHGGPGTSHEGEANDHPAGTSQQNYGVKD
jgi:cytochrome o ubiquinol oxidase subunit 2